MLAINVVASKKMMPATHRRSIVGRVGYGVLELFEYLSRTVTIQGTDASVP